MGITLATSFFRRTSAAKAAATDLLELFELFSER